MRSARTPPRFASGAGRQARGAPSASIRECLATLEVHQGPGKTIRDEPRQSSGGTGGPVWAGWTMLSDPIRFASGTPEVRRDIGTAPMQASRQLSIKNMGPHSLRWGPEEHRGKQAGEAVGRPI